MILYHYCSNQAFQSIINTRAIWLSALSLSNDTMEGKWLRNVFSKVCADEKLDGDATDKVIAHIDGLEAIFVGLGFCLSEHGDMLSQWRGYASDASGICIGFSAEYFKKFSELLQSQDKSGFSLVKI